MKKFYRNRIRRVYHFHKQSWWLTFVDLIERTLTLRGSDECRYGWGGTGPQEPGLCQPPTCRPHDLSITLQRRHPNGYRTGAVSEDIEMETWEEHKSGTRYPKPLLGTDRPSKLGTPQVSFRILHTLGISVSLTLLRDMVLPNDSIWVINSSSETNCESMIFVSRPLTIVPRVVGSSHLTQNVSVITIKFLCLHGSPFKDGCASFSSYGHS